MEDQYLDITWNGIVLGIRYTPSYSKAYHDSYGDNLAHLQIESLTSERAPLPITSTGYKSHFTAHRLIQEEGGQVSCVLDWLNAEAESDHWKQYLAHLRDLY